MYYLIFFLTDFPESEKLTLFIANMWHDIFISQSVINKAMQLVARQRAKGEVLNCLRAFLNWEKVRFIFTSCNTILCRSHINVTWLCIWSCIS